MAYLCCQNLHREPQSYYCKIFGGSLNGDYTVKHRQRKLLLQASLQNQPMVNVPSIKSPTNSLSAPTSS